jgi:sugar phosphate permease
VEYFELETRPNGTDLISTMNGIFQTGGFIGTLILPWVADKWGRRWAMAVVSRLRKKNILFVMLHSAYCIARHAGPRVRRHHGR